MRYCIDHEEMVSFEKNSFVLFKDLLSPSQVHKVLSSLSSSLKEQNESLSPYKTVFYGRDLALSSPDVRKVIFSKSIGQVACQLSKKKKLRYGGDWFWQGSMMPWGAQEGTFDSFFCVRPLVVVCLIALTDSTSSQPVPFLPEKAGDALFFSSQLNYPWGSLKDQGSDQKFLLLAYADETLFYGLNPLDPHTHNLKRSGYVFGDKLKETTHPHIVR